MAQAKNPKETLPPVATEKVVVPPTRTNFKNLILANPNYFGTLPKFGGKPVKAFSGNTTYEELFCLGLNPDAARLEAVFNINQHSGYGTGACGAGTIEYVRFFVQDAGGWHDLGKTETQVFDLAGPLPLSYSVSVDFNEARKFCTVENIVNVRAILSWELEPTAGDPNFTPVWGNVINARVQVAPFFLPFVALAELVQDKKISIDPGLLAEVNLKQTLQMNPPQTLSYNELKTLYAKTNVPSHRFGFSHANTVLQQPLAKALSAAQAVAAPQTKATPKTSPLALNLGTALLPTEELSAILAALEGFSGNTTYEQLTCAGYNPQTRELEGIIQMKQSSGFSGGLCTAGSTEYVAFYAFFGGAWQPLGTAQVQVHDLAAASPANPISYAVFRISNLTNMPCESLAGVPLRAILSWQVPPTSENFIPTWGNVINTHVQPQIGPVVEGEHVRLMRIGRVTITGISDMTGLANPTGVAGDCSGDDSPFGGETIAEGDFLPKIDVFNHVTGQVLPGAKPIIYQAWVTPSGGAPFQLTNAFGIAVWPPNAPIGFPEVTMVQSVTPPLGPVPAGVPGTKYYTYMESDLQAVNPRTLAVFEAGGLSEGQYTLEIRGFVWNGVNYVAIPVQSKMIYVYNGFPHLESTGPVTPPVMAFRPQVSITLTSPSGDCGDVQVGDTIHGSYSVTDHFFSIVSIALVPITVGGVQQPENAVVLSNANSGSSSVVFTHVPNNTNGTSGTFTLDTSGMTPCGYTILLTAWDRALVSSSCSGHYNQMGVGFCLRAKTK